MLVSILVAAVAAGCSVEGEDRERATREEPPAPTTEQPPADASEEVLRRFNRAQIEASFQRFVAAAGAGDDAAMWRLLSKPTQARFGRTLAGFRRTRAPALKRGVGALARRHRVVLVEPITLDFAVAAATGPRSAYAAALRFEGNTWRLELGGPVTLRPLVPDPGERMQGQAQAAFEIASDGDPIGEAGLWLDGVALGGEIGGTDSRHQTVFSNLGMSPPPGRHTVVAFARAGDDASAVAWTYRILD